MPKLYDKEMTALDLRLAMENALVDLELENGADCRYIRSFADEGVMTQDEGLVIRFSDGTKFQVKIFQVQ